MWLRSPFAKPVSSFERPVPLVLVDPDDQPNWQVCFRKEWLPYIVGALQQLYLQTTWKTDDDDALALVQYRAAQLISSFLEGCPVEMPDGGCVAYPMSSAMVSWYPLDPYMFPGVTPPTYSTPPFTILDADDSILHYKKGDVIVSGFPNPDSGDLTLPAIGIDVVGSGEVELHFINALNGGMCLVTVDGNTAGSEYVDLMADITSIPPESVEEVVHEIHLSTTGAHHIDCRFIPVVDDTASNPIRFGGAIRNITLCNFTGMEMDVRQDPSNPCHLQKTNDGATWVQYADLSLCKDNLSDGQQQTWWRVNAGQTEYSHNGIHFYTFPENGLPDWGSTSPYPDGAGVPAGQSAACLTAENLVTLLQQEVSQWVNALNASAGVLGIITIIAAIGVAIFTAGFAAPAIPGVAAAVVGLGASGLSSFFTSSVYDAIKCIIYCHTASDGSINGSRFSALMSDIEAQGSSAGWQLVRLWFNLRGPVGLTNAAKLAGITTANCTSCDCPDRVQIDYRENSGGALLGVGPSSVEVGQEFTITPNGNDAIFFILNKCCKITIVSMMNYVPYPTSSSNFAYTYTDCASARTNYTTADKPNGLNEWDSTKCVTRFGGVSSAGAWSIKIKITEIC